MDENIRDKVRKIKQSFRPLMNGVVSHSMRQKGMAYHLNWGIQLPQLRELASEYGYDYSLAKELWKENVRECKILATLIMPPSEMKEDLAELWMEQTQTQELVELSAFNLYQYLDFAPMMAFRWIARDEELFQMAGYQILGCLFRRGIIPDERGEHELMDQAQIVFASGSVALKHAVRNCLGRFCECGEYFEQLVISSLRDFV